MEIGRRAVNLHLPILSNLSHPVCLWTASVIHSIIDDVAVTECPSIGYQPPS
jgi:hypothetical protein